MKARSRTLLSTFVLLAVAAGALAFAWFGVEKKDEAGQKRKDAEAKLYAFKSGDVKAVTVTAKGQTTRLVRAGEKWRVEAPVTADAERATVDALVDRVAELRRKSSIAATPEPAQLAQFGLASPRARVELSLDAGKTETLQLGDENPFDGTAFVRTTSGAVELVPGDVRWSVERDTFDLRDKRVLPFEDAELSRVEVTAPGLSYALARDGTAWRLDAPLKDRGDPATTSRVLAAIRALRATAFLDGGDDRARGLDRPRWKVRLVPAQGDPRTLAVGEAPAAKADRPGPNGEPAPRALYARLDGGREVAKLADGATKDLDQDLLALRDKALLRAERDAVAGLRFTSGGQSFEVRRQRGADGGADAWRLLSPDRPASASRVSSALWTLTSLPAKRFADEGGTRLAEHGLDAPALDVALLGEDGKELDRLLVSTERGGKTYARGAAAGRIAEVEPSAVSGLPKSPADLEEKPPSPAEAKAAGK